MKIQALLTSLCKLQVVSNIMKLLDIFIVPSFIRDSSYRARSLEGRDRQTASTFVSIYHSTISSQVGPGTCIVLRLLVSKQNLKELSLEVQLSLPF